VAESTVAIKRATVAEISEWFTVGRQLLFRMARRMARTTARSHRLARRIACGIACGIACRIVRIIARRIVRIIARRITRRIACGIAGEIAGGIGRAIARGVAVSEGPSASRPTLRSDDNRVMLTDEWLHRSMRKAQVWAVALAGRPLYAEDTIGCVVLQ